MFSKQIFRQITKINRVQQVSRFSIASQLTRLSLQFQSIRLSSSSAASQSAEERLPQLLAELKKHPAIVLQLKSMQELIINKNLLPQPGADGKLEKLSLMQQVKILMDSDVRRGLETLGQLIKESGIEVQEKDAKLLLDLLKNRM